MYDRIRPQPRLNAFRDKGITITVGRVKLYKDNVLSAVIYGNNLIRSAAGGTILLGEYIANLFFN